MPVARLLAAALAVLLLSGCGSVKRSLYERALDAERTEARLQEQALQLGGQTVAYLERPGPGDAVVLIHGFGASKDHWVRFTRYLPARYRVIALDLPGHGGSTADTSAVYDAPALTRSVAATLDALNVRAAHVAGNSLGGEVASLLALERPDLVRSLGLYAPAGARGPIPSTRDSLMASGQAPLVPTTRAEWDRLYALAFVDPPPLPGPARDVLAAQAADRAPFLRRLLATLGERPSGLASRLGQITQPTLLVWGEADRILHVSALPRWQEALQDVRVELMPGVGHAPMLEQPERAALRYAAFLRRITAS